MESYPLIDSTNLCEVDGTFISYDKFRKESSEGMHFIEFIGAEITYFARKAYKGELDWLERQETSALSTTTSNAFKQ